VTHGEWSAAQSTTTLSVDGHDLEVAYYEAGRDRAGPPVVFLHGIPTWSFLWRDVAVALAGTRHVVAPDLLGYGNSAMADGFDRSIRAQEAMVEALLDALGADRVSFVAHDIGGGTALRVASHRPDHVEHLVLSNAACYDSWPVEFINGLGLPGTTEELADEETFERKMAFVFDEGLYGDPDEHAEFCMGMRTPWDSEEGRRSLPRCAVATNTNHTTELEYERITADTLLLWGGEDALQTVEYARRLRADIAGDAELVALGDAYHWVVEDRPDAYREEVLAFLGDG